MPRRARSNRIDPAEIADRLHSAAIHLLRRLRRVDDAAALPAPQLSALSVIVFGGPVTLGELARAEQVRPPSMTRVVGQLVSAGLARRKVDKGDRRIVRLTATEKGRKLLMAGRARRVSLLTKAIRKLPSGELAAMARTIGILETRIRGNLATSESSR